MASYRLHCWVGGASNLPVPSIGGWAPVLHLRCGVAEARSLPEDLLQFEVEGQSSPTFKYYMRVPVVSPLDKDVMVTVINSRAIGRGKIGTAVIPIKALVRGVPVGFRWFKLLNKKGKFVGNIYMRLLVQYPETVTLPPNSLSREAFRGYKHRGATTLLKLGVHQVEGISAPHGMKMNLLNKDTKIQAQYPEVESGMDLDDHFWVDLVRKTVILKFKVKKLASWVTFGKCFVDLMHYNTGEKEANWHKIIDKKDMVVGRVMLAVQMQFYHSVLIPPDCTVRMAEHYQEQMFVNSSTLALIRHLQESRDHAAAAAQRQRSSAASPSRGPAAAAAVAAAAASSHSEPDLIVEPLPGAAPKLGLRRPASAAAAYARDGENEEDDAAEARDNDRPAVRREKSSHLEDAAEAAVREEMLQLERALQESRLQYEQECAERERAASTANIGMTRTHSGYASFNVATATAAAEAVSAAHSSSSVDLVASPHVAYGAKAVAVPAPQLARYPSRNPDFYQSSNTDDNRANGGDDDVDEDDDDFEDDDFDDEEDVDEKEDAEFDAAATRAGLVRSESVTNTSSENSLASYEDDDELQHEVEVDLNSLPVAPSHIPQRSATSDPPIRRQLSRPQPMVPPPKQAIAAAAVSAPVASGSTAAAAAAGRTMSSDEETSRHALSRKSSSHAAMGREIFRTSFSGMDALASELEKGDGVGSVSGASSQRPGVPRLPSRDFSDDGSDSDSDSDLQGGGGGGGSDIPSTRTGAFDDQEPAALTPNRAQGLASHRDLHEAAAAEAAGSPGRPQGIPSHTDLHAALEAGEESGLAAEPPAGDGQVQQRRKSSLVRSARERIRLRMLQREKDREMGLDDEAPVQLRDSSDGSQQSTPRARTRYEVEEIPDVANMDDDSDTIDSSDEEAESPARRRLSSDNGAYRAID